MSRCNNPVSRAVTLALTGTVVFAGVAAAAEIEEVVVTARKRAENLQDVPMVVTAITSETIQRKGISDLADIAKYSSGVMLDEGFNKQDTRVVMRGLSPTRGRQNVAILQDDVDISSLAQSTAGGSFTINPRLLDVERIEVIKGPHSALYGRSAFNGAINYITRKPSEAFAANAQIDVGTEKKLEGRGSLSGLLIEDRLFGGINAAAWSTDGFYESPITGSSLGGGEGWGAALTLRFVPRDGLTFDFRSEISSDDFEPEPATVRNPEPVPLPSIAFDSINGLPPIVGAAVAANPLNRTFPQSIGSLGRARDFPAPAPSRNPLTGKDYPGSSRDIFRTTLRGDWDLGVVKLTSISHLGDNDTFQYNDALAVGDLADPAINGAQITYIDNTTTLKSQELRMQSQGEGRFAWTLGGLYWTEKLEQTTQASRCAAQSGGCVAVYQAIGTGVKTPADFTRRATYHSSYYGLAEFSITERFKASAELRYTKEKENTAAPSVVGPPSPLGCNNVVNAGRNLVNGVVTCVAGVQTAAQMQAAMTTSAPLYVQVESSFTTPRVALDYKLDDDKLVYLSASMGKKPGGLSPINGIVNVGQNIYEPEELIAYELGAKTSWLENRLHLNGAIYLQDYSEKQVSITFVNPNSVPPNQLATRVVNAASAEVKGFELELMATPTDNLSVMASYTFNDGKYEEFTDIQSGVSALSRAAISNPSACTPVTVLVGTTPTLRCELSYAGNRLEGSPKHSLVTGVELRRPWREDLEWFFNVDARYQSDRFISFENNVSMDSYWLADFRVGLKAGRKWSATAYVNNAFDDDTMKASGVQIQNWNNAYYTGGRTPISVQAPSGTRALLPDRRQFGVRLNYNFGLD